MRMDRKCVKFLRVAEVMALGWLIRRIGFVHGSQLSVDINRPNLLSFHDQNAYDPYDGCHLWHGLSSYLILIQSSLTMVIGLGIIVALDSLFPDRLSI